MVSLRGDRWCVAITRDDEGLRNDLVMKGIGVATVPILVEGPSPDPGRLAELARALETFDWVMCASARGVRALREARSEPWPASVRTAAVGPVTAKAIVEAGGATPIVGHEYTALGLWERLDNKDEWPGRRVLVTTVAEGRRELIEALRAAGAEVTEVEAYSMIPNPPDQIRRDWLRAEPDAVIIGSASTARHLVDAIGAQALAGVVVIAIGPTTSAALAERNIESSMPPHPTYLAAVDHLMKVLHGSFK